MKRGYRSDDVTEAASESVTYPIRLTVLTAEKPKPAPTEVHSSDQPTKPTFSDAPEFHVSAGTVWTTITRDNKKGYAKCLINAGGCLAMGYLDNNDRLVVNATLYTHGDSPVKIEGNVLFKENPEWDRCFNDTALEVVDTERTPVLQVIYRTPQDVAIYGLFQGNGWLMSLSPRGIAPLDPKTVITKDNYDVKRIFKYPSRTSGCAEEEK